MPISCVRWLTEYAITPAMPAAVMQSASAANAPRSSAVPRLCYTPRMKLTGDPDGLAALKSFQEGNRDYLKFLIQEATSVFEHHVDFKGPDGTQFRLIHDVKTGEFRVEKKVV